MFNRHVEMPAVVPTLSRGKHRNPRKGACFMEFASYLAGEAWTDHPRCTHPLLAETARLVNDHTSDAARSQLAPLIPSVIGVVSDDIRVDIEVALCCAQLALPIASMDRQQVLAVSILASERMLDELDQRSPGTLSDASRAALDSTPQAAAWARDFVSAIGLTTRGFRRQAAPNTVRCAVRGVANACVTDPDERLRELLERAIDVARDTCGRDDGTTPAGGLEPARRRPAARLGRGTR